MKIVAASSTETEKVRCWTQRKFVWRRRTVYLSFERTCP